LPAGRAVAGGKSHRRRKDPSPAGGGTPGRHPLLLRHAPMLRHHAARSSCASSASRQELVRLVGEPRPGGPSARAGCRSEALEAYCAADRSRSRRGGEGRDRPGAEEVRGGRWRPAASSVGSCWAAGGGGEDAAGQQEAGRRRVAGERRRGRQLGWRRGDGNPSASPLCRPGVFVERLLFFFFFFLTITIRPTRWHLRVNIRQRHV
jgi:hypothetical protein